MKQHFYLNSIIEIATFYVVFYMAKVLIKEKAPIVKKMLLHKFVWVERPLTKLTTRWFLAISGCGQ